MLYGIYITPGLIGMIQLFEGVQNSLFMVYNCGTGSMPRAPVTPLPRWYLLICKPFARCWFRSCRSTSCS